MTTARVSGVLRDALNNLTGTPQHVSWLAFTLAARHHDWHIGKD
jgi:hypothetical protein